MLCLPSHSLLETGTRSVRPHHQIALFTVPFLSSVRLATDVPTLTQCLHLQISDTLLSPQMALAISTARTRGTTTGVPSGCRLRASSTTAMGAARTHTATTASSKSPRLRGQFRSSARSHRGFAFTRNLFEFQIQQMKRCERAKSCQKF